MDEQVLLAIERWAADAKNHGGCGMTCSGVDDLLAMVAEVRRLQAELAGYVKGYDPQKTLPEVGQVVRVKTWYNSYRDASLISDKMWCWNGDTHTLTAVSRWYPLPGGER
jgi:hypothetical protein